MNCPNVRMSLVFLFCVILIRECLITVCLCFKFVIPDVKIPADKFMDSLANGALVCKLAQLIQDKAVECHRVNKAVKVSSPCL